MIVEVNVQIVVTRSTNKCGHQFCFIEGTGYARFFININSRYPLGNNNKILMSQGDCQNPVTPALSGSSSVGEGRFPQAARPDTVGERL